MKNYYEILEVSENASREVIEKAYKALVKKYHPDLQPANQKQTAENKIKEINEAYSILSNTGKREKYNKDLSIQRQIQEKQKYNQIHNNKTNTNNTKTFADSNVPNKYPKKNIVEKKYSPKNKTIQNNDLQNEFNQAINEAYNNAYANAYNQAYINTLKSMGYNIQYKKTFKEHLKSFFACIFAIIIIFIIGFILWHIPPTKSYLLDLYHNNDIIKIFVDIALNIYHSFISLFINK